MAKTNISHSIVMHAYASAATFVVCLHRGSLVEASKFQAATRAYSACANVCLSHAACDVLHFLTH